MMYFLLSQDIQSLNFCSNKMNTPSADEIYDEIIYDDYTIIDPIPIDPIPIEPIPIDPISTEGINDAAIYNYINNINPYTLFYNTNTQYNTQDILDTDNILEQIRYNIEITFHNINNNSIDTLNIQQYISIMDYLNAFH